MKQAMLIMDMPIRMSQKSPKQFIDNFGAVYETAVPAQ